MVVYGAVGVQPSDASVPKECRQQFQAHLLPVLVRIQMVVHRRRPGNRDTGGRKMLHEIKDPAQPQEGYRIGARGALVDGQCRGTHAVKG